MPGLRMYYQYCFSHCYCHLHGFREKREETERFELQKQKELEKLAKKLKVIDRERKKNRDIPYPHCNYDYGRVTKWYDPTTGKSVLSYMRRMIDFAYPFKPKR
jgi:hypothetical protein